MGASCACGYVPDDKPKKKPPVDKTVYPVSEVTWTGVRDTDGRPIGAGTEYDPKNNLTKVGNKDGYGQNYGVWEIYKDGRLVCLHEYNNGDLTGLQVADEHGNLRRTYPAEKPSSVDPLTAPPSASPPPRPASIHVYRIDVNDPALYVS